MPILFLSLKHCRRYFLLYACTKVLKTWGIKSIPVTFLISLMYFLLNKYWCNTCVLALPQALHKYWPVHLPVRQGLLFPSLLHRGGDGGAEKEAKCLTKGPELVMALAESYLQLGLQHIPNGLSPACHVAIIYWQRLEDSLCVTSHIQTYWFFRIMRQLK